MNIPKTEMELLKFHAYLRDKGLMNPTTAYSRAQAAQQVLSVLDPNEKNDLSTLDRESVFRRFVNKHGQRFTQASLHTYNHRFNAALDEFLAYAADSLNYRVSSPVRVRRTRPAPAEPTEVRETERTTELSASSSQLQAKGLLSYPVPLPSGAVAQILLPPVLTNADADRITTFVTAMVKALATLEGPPAQGAS